MEFTPRARQMLLVLLKTQGPISVKELAERTNISKRTAQRELEFIGYDLKKCNLALVSKTGVGIRVEGDDQEKDKLLDILENQDELDLADKDQRRKRLILELLKDDEPKKLYYFSNMFEVSEATVSKDLEHVEPWLSAYRLSVIRKPGLGIMLQGSEKDYRMAVREFIAQNMNTSMIQHVYKNQTESAPEVVKSKSIKNIYNILNDDILKRVCKCFASIQDGRITRLTRESYIGLVLHVTIAIERVLQHDVIEENQELMERMEKDEDFNLALLIIGCLEEEFEIEIPNIELVYICLHIKGAKWQKTQEELTPETQEEMREFVHEIIVAYDERMADILEGDEDLVHGLCVHLRPTLVRLRNKMPIENPHLEEIKHTYPEIFQRCVFVGKFIEGKTGCVVPEAEAGYLAIHFGAAEVRLENEKERSRVVDIGLVCASGIGISRLMATRLEKYMKTRARISTYGYEDVTPYVLSKTDFFVASLHMDLSEADVIEVSPLLPEKDIEAIEKKVAYYEKQSKARPMDDDFSRQLDKVNEMAARINEILKSFQCATVQEDIGFRGFLQTVAEAIGVSEVSKEMIAVDLKKREDIATQVIPELGIGLFHARTEGVLNPMMAVFTTKEGTGFSNPYFQKMKVAVVLLIPKDGNVETNSRLLGAVSQALVEDEQFLQQVESGDGLQIKQKLSRILKSYFSDYLEEV